MIPKVLSINQGQSVEIDVMLLHPAMGVVVERKNLTSLVRQGEWLHADGSRPDTAPIDQVQNNSFARCRHLRDGVSDPRLRGVPSTLAFPAATAFKGTLPQSLEHFNIIVGPDLADFSRPQDRVKAIASIAPLIGGFGEEGLNAILRLLAHGADFTWDAEGEQRRARHCLQQLFDTIIVDEAEVFAPQSAKIFAGSHGADGPQRILLLGDERQDLYARGFKLPLLGMVG